MPRLNAGSNNEFNEPRILKENKIIEECGDEMRSVFTYRAIFPSQISLYK